MVKIMAEIQGEKIEELDHVEEVVESAEVVEGAEIVEEIEEDLTWMEDETPETSEEVAGDETAESGGLKDVPAARHIEIKQKLKGKLRGEKEENEKLKARIKELEDGGGQQAQPQALSKPVRPRRDAFESDAEYDDALDVYDDELIQFIPKDAATKADTAGQLQRRVETVNKAVDGHIDRAAKLIDTHSIDPDVYASAQDNVKQIMDKVKPGGGEHIFNEFVERLGDGSEKVMFFVGKNKKQLNEFERLFLSDTSGLSAAMFLAEKLNEIGGAKNLSSRSPKPSAKLKGGDRVPANEAALKKKYQDAHKNGKGQDAFNIKKQAKAAKIDTSGW